MTAHKPRIVPLKRKFILRNKSKVSRIESAFFFFFETEFSFGADIPGRSSNFAKQLKCFH